MSLLGQRYASQEMKTIWSREFKIRSERDLWITVLKTQKRLGLEVSDEVISQYEKAKDVINLQSIDDREMKTKHDVMARIDEFNKLTGNQKIHIGMTSRDLTENIELFQIGTALELVQMKSLALIKHLADFSENNMNLAMVARTHNIPAQVTTMARRSATWMEELLFAIRHLEDLQKRLPLRGIKGPIGTGEDLNDLFGDGYQDIESEIAAELSFGNVLKAPSQIYPRSIDYEVLTTLAQIASAPSNIATNIRIMSGLGLVSEGFSEGQVGSSAMPHKVNPRLSERVNGLTAILKGYVVMVQELIGNQWNEGDVSCSVVRRVAIADSFYTIDAILDTSMRIIRDLVIHREVIGRELEENLPFMLSSKLLALAIKNGVGREDAHSIIKKYSQLASENFRKTGVNNLFELITTDKSLGISLKSIEQLLASYKLLGSAKEQCELLIKEGRINVGANPDAARYSPLETI
jgi:adenylosuccinate lyase